MQDPELPNPEEKEQSRRYNPPRIQTLHYKATVTETVVLVQKQTHRSTGQNREPRNKPIHLRTIDLQQRRQGIKWGKGSSTSGAGTIGQLNVNQ